MNNASPSSSLFIYTFANLFCHGFFYNYIFKIHERKDQEEDHCIILKSIYSPLKQGSVLETFGAGPQSSRHTEFLTYDIGHSPSLDHDWPSFFAVSSIFAYSFINAK